MSRVVFDAGSAKRIANAVRAVEAMPSGVKPGTTAGRQPYGVEARLGKIAVAWKKGTQLAVPIYSGVPGSETANGATFMAFNHFGDINATASSPFWVFLINQYVVAAECAA